MTRYAIAVIAQNYNGEVLQFLQLQGPLNSKDHAEVLSTRMNERIQKIHPDGQFSEYTIYATVLEMEPVKVKQADVLTKKFLAEIEEEARLQVSIPGGGWVLAPREEIVHSELLNGPSS